MGAQGLLSCFALLGKDVLARPLVKKDGDIDLIQFSRAMRRVAERDVKNIYGAVMQDLAVNGGYCMDKKVRNSLAVFLIEHASDMLVSGSRVPETSGIVAVALTLAEPCLCGEDMDEWRLRAESVRSRLNLQLG